MSRIVDVEPLDCLAWKDGEHGTTFDDGVLWVLEKIGEQPTIEPQQTCEYWDSESKFCALCRSSAQPERKWTPCSNPPKHHKDVIVRGIEAIGNVTVHKVMQWDVDTWRPTDYAPSVMWKEWSEI